MSMGMNVMKISLFVHPDCVNCSSDLGRDVCWSVSRLMLHGALCAIAPKCLHGKFIFLNLYPAVCWRRHCTYECCFCSYTAQILWILTESLICKFALRSERQASYQAVEIEGDEGAVWIKEGRSDWKLDAGLFSRSSSPVDRWRNTRSETILLSSSLVSLLSENEGLKTFRNPGNRFAVEKPRLS